MSEGLTLSEEEVVLPDATVRAFMTLAELARELGMDRSRARRWILGAGYQFARIRLGDGPGRGQIVNALPLEVAREVIELRASQGFMRGRTPVDAGVGWFYLLQIVPELDPLRVKAGYASSLDARLASHRTVAPTLSIVKSWPCRECWEPAALAVVEKIASQRLGAEVFVLRKVGAAVERLDTFFGLVGASVEDVL